jgi:hypothetical protein
LPKMLDWVVYLVRVHDWRYGLLVRRGSVLVFNS